MKESVHLYYFLVDLILFRLKNYSFVKLDVPPQMPIVIERSRSTDLLYFLGLGSEECNPLNMSIEAELVIEQMKEHHHKDLCRLRLELEDKVSPFHQSCSLISLSSDKLLHIGHSQFFFLTE